MKYRPEIDGLRAVAVMLVLMYHAGFGIFGRHDLFNAGEIGVDIFFVISGYLITGIILSEQLETGRFSYRNFYERRARRILPALLFVLLVLIPVAFHTLSGIDLTVFLERGASAVFFFSNIYSYFVGNNAVTDEAMFGPLVHTWSLSVEEQFYFIFPTILLLSIRYCPKYTLAILIILFFLSLQLSEFLEERIPDFGFFMLPTRFWELLAGAILACLEREYGNVRIQLLNSVMPAIGLCMIGWYLFLFEAELALPSFTTFIPVLGAALIIAFASKEDLVGSILATKPFVAIGLISYSLYLWHWPVFYFFNLTRPDSTNLDKLGWVVLSILLATITYIFIERPFRNRTLIAQKPFYVLLVMAVILILSATFYSGATQIAQLGALVE